MRWTLSLVLLECLTATVMYTRIHCLDPRSSLAVPNYFALLLRHAAHSNFIQVACRLYESVRLVFGIRLWYNAVPSPGRR